MSKVAAILRAHDLAKHQGVRRRHTTPNGPIVQEGRKAAVDYQLFSDQWEQNFHPDPMGRHNEPKSIYSPVAPARLRFDGPKKRRSMDRTEHDCDLPQDLRRPHTFQMEGKRGRNLGTVTVRPVRITEEWLD